MPEGDRQGSVSCSPYGRGEGRERNAVKFGIHSPSAGIVALTSDDVEVVHGRVAEPSMGSSGSMICVMVGFHTARWRPRNQSHWRIVKVSLVLSDGRERDLHALAGHEQQDTAVHVGRSGLCPGCSLGRRLPCWRPRRACTGTRRSPRRSRSRRCPRGMPGPAMI